METYQPSFNDGTTEQHVPVPRSSCYNCLHRLGCFVVVLLKMTLNLGLLAFFLLYLSTKLGDPKPLYCIVLSGVATFIDVVDIVLGLVLIINVCVKNLRIMELYYRYSIYVFGSLTVLSCIILYIITEKRGPVLKLLSLLASVLVMQMYINYRLKNEVLKIRSNK